MRRFLLYLTLAGTEASLNVVTLGCEALAERHPLLFLPLAPGYLAAATLQRIAETGLIYLTDGNGFGR